MKLVQQREREDCGVACVAMLIQRYAGCPPASSYDAARAIMFGLSARASRTLTRDLKTALKAFNVPIGYKRIPVESISVKDLDLSCDAILSTRENSHAEWHWMVWDSEKRIVLDPDPDAFGKRRRLAHYLRVGA